MRSFILLGFIILCVSCAEEPVPKPRAFLRLEYPIPDYVKVTPDLPFTFHKNNLAAPISGLKNSIDGKSIGIDIVYSALKGTIYLTYKPITKDNLRLHLIDAQNITQKHAQKADDIVEQPYINDENKAYGMFYEVGGDAASQSQFYLTDSINHFITGSLYFFTKPNYDSILPAADYLKNDIKYLMETIRWKE